MKRSLLVALALFGIATLAISQAAYSGPPQFVTFPILVHVGEVGLDHGHFVFTEGAAIPRPLAPNLGTGGVLSRHHQQRHGRRYQ